MWKVQGEKREKRKRKGEKMKKRILEKGLEKWPPFSRPALWTGFCSSAFFSFFLSLSLFPLLLSFISVVGIRRPERGRGGKQNSLPHCARHSGGGGGGGEGGRQRRQMAREEPFDLVPNDGAAGANAEASFSEKRWEIFKYWCRSSSFH